MDRQAAIQYVRQNVDMRDFLEPSKYGMYVCPICGSGTGSHGTGAFKYYEDTNTGACFATCAAESGQTGRSYDVIDVIQATDGLDFNEALNFLADYAGISIDNPTSVIAPKTAQICRESGFYENNDKLQVNELKAAQSVNKRDYTENYTQSDYDAYCNQSNYTAYYKMCSENLTAPEAAAYLESRGISIDTAKAYLIGYDPKSDPANAPGEIDPAAKRRHPTGRIILPSSASHYVGRRIDGGKGFEKINAKGSTPGIFNFGVVYKRETKEVFVTEGTFDALSFLEVGAAAIATNSANNVGKIIDNFSKYRPTATLILAFDKDKAGTKARDTLKEGLKKLGISFITADMCGQYKDPNEFLQHDRQGFMKAVQTAQHQTAARPDNVKYYIENLMEDDLRNFRSDIHSGFSNLDENMNCLYSGLYIIGAISGLGKTTFVHQMADQMAAAGQDVLFFSLEQSRFEITTKSIARETYKLNPDKSVSSILIREGYKSDLTEAATKKYIDTVSENLSIIYKPFDCSADTIEEYVNRYIEKTGKKPVVIVDYLQGLQMDMMDQNMIRRDLIDHSLVKLKRLANKGMVVIAISSVNRNNYLTPIDFESLKESGNCEFTSDVVWGLQYHAIHDDVFDEQKAVKKKREVLEKAGNETPRKVELKCLKNRFGKKFTCNFLYYPRCDFYKPVDKFEDDLFDANSWKSKCQPMK